MSAHLLVDQTPDVSTDESGEAVAACGLVGNLTGYYLPSPGVDCADCRECARLEREAELQRIDRERREAS